MQENIKRKEHIDGYYADFCDGFLFFMVIAAIAIYYAVMRLAGLIGDMLASKFKALGVTSSTLKRFKALPYIGMGILGAVLFVLGVFMSCSPVSADDTLKAFLDDRLLFYLFDLFSMLVLTPLLAGFAKALD